MKNIVVLIKNRKIALYEFLLIVVFSIVYSLAINILLPEMYYTGISNEKSFSFEILFFCIVDAIVLYAITELTVSKNNYLQSCTIRIVFWIYAIPMSLYPALFNPKYVWQFWFNFNIYWTLLCVLTSWQTLHRMKYISFSFPVKIKRLIGIVSIIMIIYYLVSQLHDYSFSLSLGDVYGIRQSYKEQMSQRFVGIFRVTFGIFICPCLIVFFIKARKALYSFLFIFLQLVLFNMAKDKVMLVYGLASIIIGTLSETSLKKTSKYISLAIFFVCLFNLLIIIDVLPEISFTMIIRRLFMEPARGNYLWFEFFTDNPKLWLRQDVFLIDKFFSPVYQSAAPSVIANYIGEGEYSYFNTGLMAVAYAQMGMLGYIFGPLVLGFWLNFLYGFYNKKSLNVQLMLSFSVAIAIINSTIIETGNIIIFLIIALYSVVFPNVKNERLDIACPRD